jgi:hypothetical protein
VQVALYLIHVGEGRIEIEAWSDDVVDAGDDADQIGVERERRGELLLVDVGDSAPAHGQIRVEEAWVRCGEDFGEAVGPSTLGAIRVRVVADAFGLAVAERDVAAETLWRSRAAS